MNKTPWSSWLLRTLHPVGRQIGSGKRSHAGRAVEPIQIHKKELLRACSPQPQRNSTTWVEEKGKLQYCDNTGTSANSKDRLYRTDIQWAFGQSLYHSQFSKQYWPQATLHRKENIQLSSEQLPAEHFIVLGDWKNNFAMDLSSLFG